MLSLSYLEVVVFLLCFFFQITVGVTDGIKFYFSPNYLRHPSPYLTGVSTLQGEDNLEESITTGG